MKKATKRKIPKPSLKLISLMVIFQLAQRMSANLGSYIAYHLWFHPGRASLKKIPEFKPEGVNEASIRVNDKKVHYWSAGSGEIVFLMHGWGTCGKQMASLAQGFLDKDFRVIWMDAPAHGQSSGWRTTLFEIADTIIKVQQTEGKFHTVVAHSFGVPCTFYAIRNGNLKAEKIIAIAPPATTEGLMQKFCRMIKAKPKTQELLTRRFTRFLGDIKLSDTSALTMAKDIGQKCLIIHDKHDPVTNSEEGFELHESLLHSEFVLTKRLGHNKILSDEKVVNLCVNFITSNDQVNSYDIKMTG